MNDRQIKLIIGSLLHDIGKVVYRSGGAREHSRSGCEYLKEIRDDLDKEILDCVSYHHAAALMHAGIEDDALAYITYFADNVAAAMDRREKDDAEDGFDRTVPLESVFNILNGNNGRMHYEMRCMDPDGEINYPTEEPVKLDTGFYSSVVRNITDNIRGIELSGEYINSLLSVMEANLMYIPSSTSRRELTDISLYDHVKITAAIAEAIYQYSEDNKIENFREYLFDTGAARAWTERMFMLYSMDISGIQKFIYTISSKGALKGLRARSFYLELIMEHIIDELLEALELSRACLIYSGGGHCYMLVPNTDKTRQIIQQKMTETNRWFMEHFGTELYMAAGYAECSANDLRNEPAGSYSELFKEVSRRISERKSSRYTAADIRMLNALDHKGDRECIVCRRMEKLDENNRCPICGGLDRLSGSILYQDCFIVLDKAGDRSLPLPGGRYLTAGSREELRQYMEQEGYVRSYIKNGMYTGKHVATKLWVGDYSIKGESFAELAEQSQGIKRIAVLRADVDNLGSCFVNGFRKADGNGRYETLSRTAALSRQLSVFFKCYINRILKEGVTKELTDGGERKLNIVYSGGDDVFIAGAWNDVIDAFTDIRNTFVKFTQGTLTISGGIGLFDAKYPLNRMAEVTAELEDYAKEADGKDAVTLFDAVGRYRWFEYQEHVIGEKFDTIKAYMTGNSDRGKVFLYRLLELLGRTEERFNRARFVYYLSRLEPEYRENREEREAAIKAYRDFSAKMYKWSEDPEGRRQIVTAIYLYVYLTRESEENEAC